MTSASAGHLGNCYKPWYKWFQFAQILLLYLFGHFEGDGKRGYVWKVLKTMRFLTSCPSSDATWRRVQEGIDDLQWSKPFCHFVQRQYFLFNSRTKLTLNIKQQYFPAVWNRPLVICEIFRTTLQMVLMFPDLSALSCWSLWRRL